MSSPGRESVEVATAGIGRRLAAVRKDRRLRVSELARLVGVSSSLISQIERGQSRPSVETLFSLAQVLHVPVDTFFADDRARDGEALGPSLGNLGAAPPPRASAPPGGNAAVAVPFPPSFGDSLLSSKPGSRYIVRRSERASIDIRGGVRWERLTPAALDGVEFLELVYAPGAESDPELYRHPGIELVVVTHGTMTIFVGFERHDLAVGDSIAFASSTPHRYVNMSEQEARAVTVILRDDLSSLVRGSAMARGPEDGDSAGEPPDLSR